MPKITKISSQIHLKSNIGKICDFMISTLNFNLNSTTYLPINFEKTTIQVRTYRMERFGT